MSSGELEASLGCHLTSSKVLTTSPKIPSRPSSAHCLEYLLLQAPSSHFPKILLKRKKRRGEVVVEVVGGQFMALGLGLRLDSVQKPSRDAVQEILL